MKRDEALELLAAHREELARFGVRSLALFGSVARDDAGSTSDVDLLVEFEGPPTFDRYVELSSYLEELFGCSVDLITLGSLKASLRSAIEDDLRYVPGFSPLDHLRLDHRWADVIGIVSGGGGLARSTGMAFKELLQERRKKGER